MRLDNVHTKQLHRFDNEDRVSEYAIFSHTSGHDGSEVTHSNFSRFYTRSDEAKDRTRQNLDDGKSPNPVTKRS
jgi:hypothetical protein